MRVAGVAVAAALAVSGSACTGSEVMRIGPQLPSRPADCQVDVYFSRPPPYPVVDVASARAQCHALSGRNECMAELRRDACRLGADTMYGFTETVRLDYTFVSATLAVQDTSATVTRRRIIDVPPRPQPTAASDGGCEPICSPGFACQAGQCIPQCNPPCEAGEICTRKRLCERAASAQPPVAGPPAVTPPPAPAAPPPAGAPAPPTSARVGRPPNAPPPSANPELTPTWPPSGPVPPPSEPQLVKRRGKAGRPVGPDPFSGE
jgi:hypothetical protein